MSTAKLPVGAKSQYEWEASKMANVLLVRIPEEKEMTSAKSVSDDLAKLKFLSMCGKSTALGFGVIKEDGKYTLRYVADEYYDVCYFPSPKVGTKCSLDIGEDANITLSSVNLVVPTRNAPDISAPVMSQLRSDPVFVSQLGGRLTGSARLSTTSSSAGRSSQSSPSSARATPTMTRLTHGADPKSGGDYCQDKDGKKYSTAPSPTPNDAYQPCVFNGSMTPIPYDTPRTSMTITDAMGTVRFCPSATPDDLRVHTSYDCGSHATSLSVVPSIASAYSSRVSASMASASSASAAAASASAKVEGRILWAFHDGVDGPSVYAKWSIFTSGPDEKLELCKDDAAQSYTTKHTGSITRDNVPFPGTKDDIDDLKIGDTTFSGCKYTKSGEHPGTLKCDGWKEVDCEKAPYIDEVYSCGKGVLKSEWLVPKVVCTIRGGDK